MTIGRRGALLLRTPGEAPKQGAVRVSGPGSSLSHGDQDGAILGAEILRAERTDDRRVVSKETHDDYSAHVST